MNWFHGKVGFYCIECIQLTQWNSRNNDFEFKNLAGYKLCLVFVSGRMQAKKSYFFWNNQPANPPWGHFHINLGWYNPYFFSKSPICIRVSWKRKSSLLSKMSYRWRVLRNVLIHLEIDIQGVRLKKVLFYQNEIKKIVQLAENFLRFNMCGGSFWSY